MQQIFTIATEAVKLLYIGKAGAALRSHHTCNIHSFQVDKVDRITYRATAAWGCLTQLQMCGRVPWNPQLVQDSRLTTTATPLQYNTIHLYAGSLSTVEMAEAALERMSLQFQTRLNQLKAITLLRVGGVSS